MPQRLSQKAACCHFMLVSIITLSLGLALLGDNQSSYYITISLGHYRPWGKAHRPIRGKHVWCDALKPLAGSARAYLSLAAACLTIQNQSAFSCWLLVI